MQELRPLFPSGTHKALPVAFKILSTLRSQTAPGRGNDLRPEEKTALVGVAALLACERVDSRDLSEKGVQRASSVSPAHFRSALAMARRVLESSESTSTLTPRSTRSTPTKASPTGLAPSSSPLPAQPVFTTPRKVRNTSNKDYADLLTPHAHSPAKASPLRHDVTPSKEQADPPTPTKTRSKATPSLTSSRRQREREGAALFEQHLRGANAPLQDQNPFIAPHVDVDSIVKRAERVEKTVRRRRTLPRQDWTFREKVWAVTLSSKTHLSKLLKAQKETATAAESVEGAILSAWA